MIDARDGNRVRAAALRCLGGFCFFAMSGLAGAQNLVTNPQFIGSSAGWAPDLASTPAGSGGATWTGSFDADNYAASGSSQIDVSAAGPAGTAKAEVAAVQCVAIPGGQQSVNEARYSARLRLPSGGDTALNASIQIRFYSDAGCGTAIADAGAGQGRVLDPTAVDAAFWYALSDPQFVPNGAPISAQSFQVRLAVTKLADTSSAATVQFDNIVVALNGTTPVQLQRFEVE